MSHNPNNNIDLNDEIQEQFERYNLLLQEKQKRSKKFHEFSQKNQDRIHELQKRMNKPNSK